jgi:hypothetical protein
MARAEWKSATHKDFARNLTEWRDRLIEKSIENLVEAVRLGDATLKMNLEFAITPTGVRREERGGKPGRHETGTMVNSVSHSDADSISVNGHLYVAYFGWAPTEYKAYFRDQDLGTAKIPAAEALAGAFVAARENFRGDMNRMSK